MTGGLADTTVTLWRCHECGKWSHAVKKPRAHQRPVFEEPAAGVKVISHEEPFYSEYDGESFELWWVRCGPFDEWRAERVSS